MTLSIADNETFQTGIRKVAKHVCENKKTIMFEVSDNHKIMVMPVREYFKLKGVLNERNGSEDPETVEPPV